MTDVNYLIVEDDEPKLNSIYSLLQESDSTATIFVAASVASAVKILSEHVIDFAVLDMSLPAFDILAGISSGGQPQGFGGRDVLRFLEDFQENARAAILTQYEEFNVIEAEPKTKKLNEISLELEQEFGDIILGVIYYSGRRGEWRDQLKKILLNSITK